jgi:hypothetical protein
MRRISPPVAVCVSQPTEELCFHSNPSAVGEESSGGTSDEHLTGYRIPAPPVPQPARSLLVCVIPVFPNLIFARAESH